MELSSTSIVLLFLGAFGGIAARNPDQWNQVEKELARFIDSSEAELLKSQSESLYKSWAYATNINDETEAEKKEYQRKHDALVLRIGKEVRKFDITQVKDFDLRRKYKKLSDIKSAALPSDKRERFNSIVLEMEKIFSKAKVPDYRNKSVLHNLDSGLYAILRTSRDEKELKYYWDAWRRESGQKMRSLYLEYVELLSEYARLNGYQDGTESKVSSYESDSFVKEMAETWKGLKPLYEELHAYVRYKLAMVYGEDVVPKNGPIPAHLLGNMWAQNWKSLAKDLQPYPEKPSLDVTDEMVRQGWTPKIMFEKADEFFQSLGLDPMPETFWKGSLIERPDDGRDLICHASAWDFYNGEDFRIKQCTQVSERDFVVVNHEMGHIQYQMSYRNQSFLYRNGANPGFHEGVADVLSLAVSTAVYYQRLGLLSKEVDVDDYETDINILFGSALSELAFMPFGYLVDKYRWDLFSGNAPLNDLNCHWVNLRLSIQGLSPANLRTEEDFDPGCKFHVAADVGYVRYFTAFIYKFQFYKALCEASGHYDPGDPTKPLHHCNFYGSKVAGDKFYEMLRLGASKPWKEVMEVMTGEPKMDSGAFREYYRPLEDWLRKTNKENGVETGWTYDVKDYCINSDPAATTPVPRTA